MAMSIQKNVNNVMFIKIYLYKEISVFLNVQQVRSKMHKQKCVKNVQIAVKNVTSQLIIALFAQVEDI